MIENIIKSVSRELRCVFTREDVQYAEHLAKVKSKGDRQLFYLIFETELENVVMRGAWNG